MVSCKFCDGAFANEASLIHHQQKAKYCLEKQTNPKKSEFICIGCNKDFTTKRRFILHQEGCVKYHQQQFEKKYAEREQQYKKIINDKDKQIQDLQNKIENLAIKALNANLKFEF